MQLDNRLDWKIVPSSVVPSGDSETSLLERTFDPNRYGPQLESTRWHLAGWSPGSDPPQIITAHITASSGAEAAEITVDNRPVIP